jgi:protein-S-isoprenylcysteine O-methyltransferase Ste14
MHRFLPPPLAVAICALAMWSLNRAADSARFAFAGQRAAALALLAIALALMSAAVIEFVRARTTINPMHPARAAHLITRGVFRFSRNPIYLADALLLAALALWLGNAWNFALVAAFVVYIDRFQIRPEERTLTQLFGAAYTEYCARVRRWL